MILKLLICLLLIPLAYGGEKELVQKISKVKKFVREKHAEEFREVSNWSKNNFRSKKPKLTPKFLKAMGFFEKLYGSVLNDPKAQLSPRYQKYEQSYAWYRLVNLKLKREEYAPESDGFYALVGYMRLSETVKLETADSTTKLTKVFSGFTFGGGWQRRLERSVYKIQGEIFFTNADLVDTTLNYEQKSAVSRGVLITPYYGYALDDQWTVLGGLILGYNQLNTSKVEGLDAKLESSLLIGPEVGISWGSAPGFMVQGGISYLTNPAFKIAAGYQF